MQIKSILLCLILVVVLVFSLQFVCAGNLKPPFRLLWDRKQTLTQFCNNRCIQTSLYGFDVIDPLTGRVSLSRHFRSDALVGCNEQQGHTVIFVCKKKLMYVFDIDAGKVLWNVLLDTDRRCRDLLFDKNRLYSEFRQGVITAIDTGKGAVLWKRDVMSNPGSKEREECNSLILRDGGDGHFYT
ncbi:MAG: PQQ-binding-like beta-propeller repeat protein [Candidatus Xenobiia bacterium LiM19]